MVCASLQQANAFYLTPRLQPDFEYHLLLQKKIEVFLLFFTTFEMLSQMDFFLEDIKRIYEGL